MAYLGRCVLVITAYVLLGRLGLMIAPVGRFTAVVWPCSGIALAALVLGGYRLWPAVSVSSLLMNLWLGAPVPVVFGLAFGDTLEALAGAWILLHVGRGQPSLDRFRDVAALLVPVGVGCTLLGALIGALSLSLGASGQPSFARLWSVWWVADFLGDIIVAPLLLTWARRPGGRAARARPARIVEAIALVACLVGMSVGLFFTHPAAAVTRVPLLQPYVLFLPLIWAALRFGSRGAVTGVFLVATVAIVATQRGYGSYALDDRTDGLLALHVFLACAAVASLILAAVVAEREQSRRSLREGQSLLRAILDGTVDCVYLKDQTGRYEIMNAAGARFVGLPADAVIGKDDRMLFRSEDAQKLTEVDEGVLRSGESRMIEEVMHVRGRSFIFQTTKAPFRDTQGRVIGVIGISRDVTERRSEELERAQLAAIVESSADAVIGKTLDGTITSWNEAATRMFGHEPDAAIGQKMDLIIPPDRLAEHHWLNDRARRGERVTNHETLRVCKDGRAIEVALTLSPIRDRSANIFGISTIARDITERRRVERELRESEAQQRLAVEVAHLGTWCWDPRSGDLVWSLACRRMHGLRPDEPVGMDRFRAALHPDDRQRTEREIQRSIAERDEYRIEHRVVWPDASVHWISVLGRAFFDGTGTPSRMLGVSIDITAQKRAEEERLRLLECEKAARAEAQAATRAKDEFLAVLSHELRSPLQSMLGWTQMLKDRTADERVVQRGLETIERNVKMQAQLIEDLLDVSRIVAGKLRIERRRIDLGDVVAASITSAELSIEAKGIELEAPRDLLPTSVFGDPDRLQQVVSNLLSNAVKFTPCGGQVAVRLERDAETARVVVADSGQGIAADFLPRVFDRFRQAETTTSGAHGGLGLGLTIVQHIVGLHGGSVRVESPGEGLGATFTVTLPLCRDEVPALLAERRRLEPSRSRTPVTLDGARVLVVDDDPHACDLLERALRALGAQVLAVRSAGAALAALPSFRPQLLLSDIGMPGEDGYSLIRQVRALDAISGVRLPAIALTALASPTEREQTLSHGFDAHVAKPANLRELGRTVAKLVGQSSG